MTTTNPAAIFGKAWFEEQFAALDRTDTQERNEKRRAFYARADLRRDVRKGSGVARAMRDDARAALIDMHDTAGIREENIPAHYARERNFARLLFIMAHRVSIGRPFDMSPTCRNWNCIA